MLLQDLVGFIAVAGVLWGLQALLGALANGLDMPAGAMLQMAGVALLTALGGALVWSVRPDRPRALGHGRVSPTSARIECFASEQMPYFLSAIGSVRSTAEPLSSVHFDLLHKQFIRKCMRITNITLSLALICFIVFVVISRNNFHMVTADIYRSGQLSSDEWTKTYNAHPYSSVLNLRGKAEGRVWYAQETDFSAAYGLVHYDLTLSSTIIPSDAQMEALVGLMREAPKPLLIHCKSGADRSGLVSALYLYAIEGADAAEATKQLSIWYGHFPWLTSRTGAMDEALARFIKLHPKGTLSSDAGHASTVAFK